MFYSLLMCVKQITSCHLSIVGARTVQFPSATHTLPVVGFKIKPTLVRTRVLNLLNSTGARILKNQGWNESGKLDQER